MGERGASRADWAMESTLAARMGSCSSTPTTSSKEALGRSASAATSRATWGKRGGW